MKSLSHARRMTGLLLGLWLLVSGCETVQQYSLTYKVWDTDDFRKWSEPAPDPCLALFETPDHAQVFVAYDAYSEKRSVIKRQAYYLQPNQAQIDAGKAPRFVPPVPPAGMNPIPVFAARALGPNPPPKLTDYAVLAESGRAFTLCPQAEAIDPLPLPVYPERSGTAVRVALTPFAAVGDTVMVGLVASVAALVLACESGFSFTP
jgi:hypothetical protein